MGAISPDEARNKFRAIVSPDIAKAIEDINNALTLGYKDGPITVAAVRLGSSLHVRDIVAQEFINAGWAVKLVTDQRDGDYYTFKRREESR